MRFFLVLSSWILGLALLVVIFWPTVRCLFWYTVLCAVKRYVHCVGLEVGTETPIKNLPMSSRALVYKTTVFALLGFPLPGFKKIEIEVSPGLSRTTYVRDVKPEPAAGAPNDPV